MKRKQQAPKVTTQEALRVLRELEQSGHVVSRLCPDGRIRWFSTGKPDSPDDGNPTGATELN